MPFEAILVSRIGPEYYIGEIEDLVKSDYNALKGNPDELRSQIRERIKLGDISKTAEDREAAKRALRDEATTNGWGIVDIASIVPLPKLEIKPTKKPTTEPEEHPSAEEQPTTTLTIEYAADANVYASSFFKEGVELFGDLAALLVGEQVHFDNILTEVLMLRTARNISKGSESIGAGLLPDQELALKREQTIESYLKEHADYETRRTSEESRSAIDKDESDVLAERVLHKTVWAELINKPFLTHEDIHEAYQRARRMAYALMPKAFSDRNEFDSSLKEIDTKQHIIDIQKIHKPETHLIGELEFYTEGESEEVMADIKTLVGKEVDEITKTRQEVFDSAADTRKILEAVDKSLGAIRESVISKYYIKPIKPEDRKKEDPAADKKRLVSGILYKVWDKLYGEKIRQLMKDKRPADADLSEAYETAKRKANALMPAGELEEKIDVEQHRKNFMATFLTKSYLEGELEEVRPNLYEKLVEAEVDKIIKLKQDSFISADDPREIPKAVDKSLESIRKDIISKYIKPEDRKKEPAADYETLAERVLHKTIWAELTKEEPTDEVLIKAYKEARRMAYALIPGVFEDREELEAKLKAAEIDVKQHREDFRKMHLTEAYLLRELEPYMRGESEEVTADIKDLVGEQAKRISQFRDSLFNLPEKTREVLREVDKSLGTIRKDIISKYYIKQEDSADKKTLAERILHGEGDKLYQKTKGKGLSDDDFSKAYEAAKRKTNALMPDGKLEEKFDLKQHKRDFVAMFLPERYQEKQLKGIRPHLYGEFVEAEVDDITKTRQGSFDSLGDTGKILYKVEKSLEAIKGKALTKLIGEEYNGSEEHKKRAAVAIKYSRLAELGEEGRTLKEELEKLREEKGELEGKLGEIEVVGDEAAQEYGKRLGETEEKIKRKEAQFKPIAEPTNEEYKSAIQAIITETKIFLGATYPVTAKDLAATLKSDYRRQNNTFDAVCDIIAPLYVGIKIAEEGGEQDQYRTTPGKPTDKEKELIIGIISGFKSKPGNYMTKEALQELVGPIRAELQKFHLGKRHKHYERLKKSLSYVRPAKEIAAKSLVQTKFDYLIQATVRYYHAREISEKDARATLERLEHEELAEEFFSRVCEDLDLKLTAEAGERAPSDEELEVAYKIAVAKAHAVMLDFTPTLERKYQKGAQGKLTDEGITGLKYNYWDAYRHEELIAKAKDVDEYEAFVDRYVLPEKWIKLWEKIGDRQPSPEELLGAYKGAMNDALRIKPELFGSATQKDVDELVGLKEEDGGELKAWLSKYAPIIRVHKRRLELEYLVAPIEKIEENYRTRKIGEKFRAWFPVWGFWVGPGQN